MSHLVTLPSYLDSVPSTLGIDLNPKQSIIIRGQDDVEMLVGLDARHQNPHAPRIFGGTLRDPQYQILLKALIAKTLGEGEHHLSIALSVPINHLGKFVSGPRSVKFSDENEALFREIIAHIDFKDHSSDDWKTCRVSLLESPLVYAELQAVTFAIPREIKSYVLWQLGHGDLQQLVMVSGKPIIDTISRQVGLSQAISYLGNDLGLSKAEADRAWVEEKRPAGQTMNGATECCIAQKRKSARSYCAHVFGDLLNRAQKYLDRASNIILSGGGAKDNTLFEVISSEVEGRGYKLHRINDLPTDSKRLNDPLYTCVEGLCTRANLGIDLGNSQLKAKWEK